jgi:RNA polymerase sigma-70 factor, ECF subfamily
MALFAAQLEAAPRSPRDPPPLPIQPCRCEIVVVATDYPSVSEPVPDNRADGELVQAVVGGDTESFEVLVVRYQPRVFATARRYARREDEVEDIVQEVFLKAFDKLGTFRGEAPFEHWLMRLAVRTCYDFLRVHQRRRELTFTEYTREESDWLERYNAQPDQTVEGDVGARELLQRVLGQLSPDARLVITLLEIEDRSVREIAALTGWSESLVKVRAFRARRQMRKLLQVFLKGERL